MGLVKEEELELGAGSLGLGFGPFSGDGSKIGQHHLGWQIGGDGSLHSSRSKPEQGGGADVDGDDGGGGGGGSGGWFVTNNNDNNNNNNNNARLNLAAYWFTAEQWRELQLQGMIYKHLVAGMPIPQEYLRELGWPIHNPAQIPAMAAQYYADRTGGAGINVGHPAAVHHLPGVAAAAAVDPEPQRCRRTDGKKWRCGNEAAPGKRYCEKHLHRSRPRSRKPVEQQQQQQFMPPHVPIVPTTNKFGITAAQEPSQVPGRKHPSPPQPPTRPVGLEAPPPPTKDEISSWNMMDRKKARSEEEGVVRLGSISNVRPEQQTMRQQHMSHDKLKSEQQWQPQPQHHQQMEQHHSYYPYPTYQDDSFFSLLNSDINSLNERHLSFANPWSTPAGGGTLSTEPADKYIDFARGYDNSRSNSLSASVSVSSAPRCVPQSSPHLSLVPGAREEGAGGLQLLNAAAGNGGGESTKPPPLWWLADTLLTSDMAPAAGTAPHQPATDDEEPGGVVSPATADNSSAAASPTGVLQRPLASISDCSSNSSEAFGLQGTGGGAEATGHLHWMIKP